MPRTPKGHPLTSHIRRAPTPRKRASRRARTTSVQRAEEFSVDLEQIIKLADPFCGEHIDAGYAELVHKQALSGTEGEAAGGGGERR